MARSPSAQDDARENRLVDLFNLMRPENRVRHGVDALLMVGGHQIEFELKSVTTANGSISTVRDLGPDHITKWTNKHWIVAFFSGEVLISCRYGSPTAMAPWIAKTWAYIKNDFEIAKLAPAEVTFETMYKIIGRKKAYTLEDAKKLHKQQYSATQYSTLMDLHRGYSSERMLEIFRARMKYVIERGSTLNNPHIPFSYFSDWPEIKDNYAATLRKLVKEWVEATPALKIEQGDTP